MIIKSVRFKRTKNGAWERGLSLELNGRSTTSSIDICNHIIDEEGFVQEVYTLQDELTHLCLEFDCKYTKK